MAENFSELVRVHAFKSRLVKRRLVKQSAKQLSLSFPLRQLHLDLKSVTQFPLPRREHKNKREVAECWIRLTRRKELLESWTAGPILKSSQDNGFIYFYHLGDQLRYIGQTRRRSFFKRWSHECDNGDLGYSYDIKRCLLNAAYRGILRIQTHEFPLRILDDKEVELIQKHAPRSRLWNRLHNPRFSESNFSI